MADAELMKDQLISFNENDISTVLAEKVNNMRDCQDIVKPSAQYEEFF